MQTIITIGQKLPGKLKQQFNLKYLCHLLAEKIRCMKV